MRGARMCFIASETLYAATLNAAEFPFKLDDHIIRWSFDCKYTKIYYNLPNSLKNRDLAQKQKSLRKL